MKLYAVQRPGLVAHAHDLAFFRPGANDEIRMIERLAPDHQTVIARRFEGIRQTREYS